MIFAALTEAADRGRLILIDGGFCRWHLRRDGTAVIRELLVLPAARGRGLGRYMVAKVRSASPNKLIARCPLASPSNGFWKKMGFALVGEGRGCAVWECPADAVVAGVT